MAEVFAVVLAAVEARSALQEITNIINDGRGLLEKVFRNPEVIRKLIQLYERLLREIVPIADECQTNSIKLRDSDLGFFKVRIDELKKNVQQTLEKLRGKLEQLRSRWYRIRRARSTSDWLSELDADGNRADQLLLDIKPFFATAALMSQQAEEVKTAIETVSVTVGDLVSHWNEQDSFCGCVDVPTNPAHVKLKFQSTLQWEEEGGAPSSLEDQLKRAVLGSDGSRSSRPVDSSFSDQGVGMEGMSGVGKTCALRGLAKDADVVNQFRDGIYFMSLGQEAKKMDVVEQVAQMIEVSGGRRAAREVLEKARIDNAISKARLWFEGRCVLVLIDDVWQESESGRDIVSRLSDIIDVAKGSRVVFTTRDRSMTLRSVHIHFGTRDAATSLRILLGSAGVDAEETVDFRGTVEKALKLCGGVPMALAVAGSAIKLRMASGSGCTMEETWDQYVREVEKYRKILLGRRVDSDGYGTLGSAFWASLSMMERMMKKGVFRPKMGCSEMYRGLVVVRRQGWVPVTVLERLWESKDEVEALYVMQELVDGNLAVREDRVLNGKKTAGISLHDLHLDFAHEECERHDGVGVWHRKVVRSYIAGDLWDDAGGQDEYIRNNVSRHMVRGGLEKELWELLKNPRWAVKRLHAHEILGLEEDIRMMIDCSLGEYGEAAVARGGKGWSLKMISSAARLSSAYVTRNPGEVWFQLHARLFGRAEESEVIKAYRARIEECAERPWLKAVMGCVPEPGGALQSTVLCDGEVKWISEGDGAGKGKTFACGLSFHYPSKAAFVSTIVKGQVEKTVSLSLREEGVHISGDGVSLPNEEENGSGTTDEESLLSSADIAGISAVCCMRDGTCAVTGHVDGTLRLWDAQTGEAVGDALRGHNERVISIEWSPDGTRVLSGSQDKTMRVWDTQTGETVGDALRGHSESVWCVAWSPDGTRVASGSRDKTMRVWDAQTGEAVGGALRGHSGSVGCVAWSPDGTRVVSGSEDKTMRVWDAQTGEAVGDPLRGHSESVRSVAWSPDGMRVVSGSEDKTMRVWDAQTGEAVCDALRGHSGWVRCVAWSADGSRVLSGSADETVRAWEAQSGAAVGNELGGHSDGVVCVAWSADGARVASGSGDKTVRVWDARTGEAVGDALRGHGEWVMCVAWSPDGTRVASGSGDGTVRVWEAGSGEAVGGALRGHGGLVGCVAWSPDGRRVASGSDDGTVRVWEARTGEGVGGALRGHGESVRGVGWSADGKRVASGGVDGSARVWEVETGVCVRTEDGWGFPDRRALRDLLGDGDGCGKTEEEVGEGLRVEGERRVVVGGGVEASVLVTLEEDVWKWEFCRASGKVALGFSSGAVSILELVE